ncbi:PepSY-associated TM helix domain-containing protein [Paracoccus binzhouensis]|nr:PepSY-associated TM helix domain-containing protein [Paracoccus binzhouensis]
MAMFIAIISGVIIHKKIFKEFFTFHPRKGQRSWLDMHNMTGVLALPDHLMITFSGRVLFAATLMPLVAQGPDPRAPGPAAEASVAASPAPPPLAAIAPLIVQAEATWSMPVGRILIEKRDLGMPEIVLVSRRNSVVTVHGGSGSNGVERMRFDGRDGRLIEATGQPRASAVARFGNALGSLHRARFADIGLRWLFFVAGLAGTAITGSGLLLWVSKRAAKHALAEHPPPGLRLVQRLNIGGIAGRVLATTGYFRANRLIPAALPDRPQAEIADFFSIWLLATSWAFLRPQQKSWSAQLGLTAAPLLGLLLLSAATGPVSLPQAIWRGDWVRASVELAALLRGLICGHAAWRAHPGSARPAGRARLVGTGRNDGGPVVTDPLHIGLCHAGAGHGAASRAAFAPQARPRPAMGLTAAGAGAAGPVAGTGLCGLGQCGHCRLGLAGHGDPRRLNGGHGLSLPLRQEEKLAARLVLPLSRRDHAAHNDDRRISGRTTSEQGGTTPPAAASERRPVTSAGRAGG